MTWLIILQALPGGGSFQGERQLSHGQQCLASCRRVWLPHEWDGEAAGKLESNPKREQFGRGSRFI